MRPQTESNPKHLRIFRSVVLAAAIMLFILMVSGGVVRVTESGGSCLDWPTCYGSWKPPAETSPFIDYTHRLATFLSLPFILGVVFIAWRHLRSFPWIFRLSLVSAGLFFAQIALGAGIAISASPPSWIGAVHLVLSLLLQSSLVFAWLAAVSTGKIGSRAKL